MSGFAYGDASSHKCISSWHCLYHLQAGFNFWSDGLEVDPTSTVLRHCLYDLALDGTIAGHEALHSPSLSLKK